MESITYIELDLQAPNPAVCADAKQNDRNTRKIAALLKDGDVPFTPDYGAAAMIRFKKPDGTAGFYDTLEDSSPAYSISGSVITFTLVEQMTTAPGNVLVEVNFYTLDDKLTTFYFILRVQASALSDAEIISTDYYNVLSQQIQGLLGATTHPPIIDPVTRNWMLWDENSGAYADSGYSSVGTQGPVGPQGESIASTRKISTVGTVDTYEVVLGDGAVAGTFTVTNGTGAVDSVNGQNGTVLLDADDIPIDDTTVGAVLGGEAEYSGSIVSFQNAFAADLNSLTVDIEPQQNLNGYDSPWSPGGGKNKLRITETTTTVSGVTLTVNGDGSITANGTATGTITRSLGMVDSAGSYILNGCPSGGGDNYRLDARISAGSVISGALDTGNGVTFSAAQAFYVYLRIGAGTVLNNLTFYPMVRLSSVTDAAFAPYANLCPITGWDEVNIYQSGADASKSKTVTIDLGGTVYGGTLDAVSGVLTVDKKIAVFDGSEPFSMTGGGVLYIDRAATDGTTGELVCSMYPYGGTISGAGGATGYPKQICSQALNGIRLAVYDDTFATAAAFNTYLASTPLQIVYPLAEPVTHQLTGTQISLLIGFNTFWADAGNITINFSDGLIGKIENLSAANMGAVAIDGSVPAEDSAADLDSFLTGVGIFGAATGVLNAPFTPCLVIAGGGSVMGSQIAVSLNGTYPPKARYYTGGAWSAWADALPDVIRSTVQTLTTAQQDQTRNNIAAMKQKTLLWENAAPSSAFAAQTVALDLTDYDFVEIGLIHAGQSGSQGGPVFSQVRIGETNPTKILAFLAAWGIYISSRNVTVTAAGVTFSEGYNNGNAGSSGSQDNSVAIPIVIYGIKGVIT